MFSLAESPRPLADPDRIRYWVARYRRLSAIAGQAAITREWSDWRNGWIWWFQSVYVAQAFRRQGIFRALYRHIHGIARSQVDVSACGFTSKTPTSALD